MEVESRIGNPKELFSGIEHQEIWEHLQKLAASGKTVSLAAMKGKAEMATLTELLDHESPIAVLDVYIHTAIEFQQKRIALRVGRQLMHDACNGKPVLETITDAEKVLFKSQHLVKSRQTTNAIVQKVIDDWQWAEGHQGEYAGIPSGFTKLDRLTWGFAPSLLHIIGARPSKGKTAMLTQMMGHAACTLKIPSLMFSLESSSKEIVKRVMCQRGQVDGMRMRRGQGDEEDTKRVMTEAQVIRGSPFHIIDDGALTISQIRSIARRYVGQHGVKIIWLDYIQKCRPDKNMEKRTYEVGQISSGLKEMAKELDIPVVATAQLSREINKGKARRPIIDDLADSSELDRDGDIIALLHEGDTCADGGAAEFELVIAKNRDGPSGIIPLTFVKRFVRFEPSTPEVEA